MRTPRNLVAPWIVLFVALVPAVAQFEDHAAAPTSDPEAVPAAGAAFLNNNGSAPILAIPPLNAAMAPSPLTPAPTPNLAPAARPEAAALPASPVAPAQAVSAEGGEQAPKDAAAEPGPARAPPDAEAARRYVRSIAGSIKIDDRQTDALLEQFFDARRIPHFSPQADAVRRELIPARVEAEDKAVAPLVAPLRRHRGVLLKLARDRAMTPAAIQDVLIRRGALAQVASLDGRTFESQVKFALQRDELDRAVAGYPDDAPGRFLRDVAANMTAPSGKSVEEIARDGVFAYVDFSGSSVLRASSGRDPDEHSSQAVFYVTRAGARWRIGGYRQNRPTGRGDAELVRALKNWLVAAGIPAADLE